MNFFENYTPRIETPEEIQDRAELEALDRAEAQLKALRRGGYPERAIQAAENAKGPGAEKALSLQHHATGEGLLLLLGPTGRGKTVIAVLLAMARQAQSLKPGEFTTAFSLFTSVKSSYGNRKTQQSKFDEFTNGPGKERTAEELIAWYGRAPFLVIDEVQTRSESSWEDGLLDEIVNARYGALLPTVLIANFTPMEAQKNLGPRIMDRARESGGIVNCNWTSYRAAK